MPNVLSPIEVVAHLGTDEVDSVGTVIMLDGQPLYIFTKSREPDRQVVRHGQIEVTDEWLFIHSLAALDGKPLFCAVHGGDWEEGERRGQTVVHGRKVVSNPYEQIRNLRVFEGQPLYQAARTTTSGYVTMLGTRPVPDQLIGEERLMRHDPDFEVVRLPMGGAGEGPEALGFAIRYRGEIVSRVHKGPPRQSYWLDGKLLYAAQVASASSEDAYYVIHDDQLISDPHDNIEDLCVFDGQPLYFATDRGEAPRLMHGRTELYADRGFADFTHGMQVVGGQPFFEASLQDERHVWVWGDLETEPYDSWLQTDWDEDGSTTIYVFKDKHLCRFRAFTT